MKRLKFIITLILWWILWIGIQSFWLLFFVNSWLTDEKWEIWNQIKLWGEIDNELVWSKNNLNTWTINNLGPISKLQINELENIKLQLEQYISQKKELEKKKEWLSLCILSTIRSNDTIIWDLFITQYKKNWFEWLNEKYKILKDFLSNMWKENKIIEKCSNSKLTIEEFNLIKNKQKETSWYLWTLSKNKSFIYIMDFFLNEERNKPLDKVVSILWNDVSREEILSIISSEQVRASNTYRWFFKNIMKNNILQSYTQFSLWISGIKENTAIKIEDNLKNPKSPYYLGKKYENLLDFKTKNIKQERIDRLTNQNNYYWQYLYTWIFIKMIKHQWEQEGYPLWNNHIWIISTLFNIGIDKSKPKNNPRLWGALFKVDGQTFLFWEISEISYLYQKLKLWQ